MRTHLFAIMATLVALAACGQPAPSGGEAASGEAAAPAGPLTAADHAALLGAINLTPDAQGQVTNECNDKVTPTFSAAELGGAVGTAQLVAIPGGPSLATCYGDGPDLHLMMRDGASWREIYSARGRMLIILSSETGGVKDLADGGPGFSFPVWTWNGTAYAAAAREISDSELSNAGATYLP